MCICERQGVNHLAFFILPILSFGFLMGILPKVNFLNVLPLLPIILGLIKTDRVAVVVIISALSYVQNRQSLTQQLTSID